MDEKRKLFNKVARGYDVVNTVTSLGTDGLWREHTARRIYTTTLERNAETGKILDLAAGTGKITQEIRKFLPKTKIILSDISEDMINVAKEKLTRKKIENVSFTVENANEINYENEFDTVVCAFGFRNFAENKSVLEKINRALKPGGLLFVLEFFNPQNGAAKFFVNSYVRFLIPTVGFILNNRAFKEYAYLSKSIKNYKTSADFINLAESSGIMFKEFRTFAADVVEMLAFEKPMKEAVGE